MDAGHAALVAPGRLVAPAVSSALFHPAWHRVASLTPRLRSHTKIHRHHYRGELWFVLQNHASGRFFRFTPSANYLISLMDGERTVESLWQLACETLGDAAPTQSDVVRLMAQLHEADVLLSDQVPDNDELSTRAATRRRERALAYVRNPLALRIPLWDPDAFVRRTLPLVGPCFTRLGALVWLLIVGLALVLVGIHFAPLTENIVDRALSVNNLLLLWLVVPVVKFLHEMGHAYAVRRFRGEVHEMGLMLLVLVPIPYVDASAASAFRRSGERTIVGAAGMLTELLVAAVAMFVWVNVEPGWTRAVAFNVMLVAGISTLLFNLNPLLRFDGYYILSDLLQIPNLGPRANRYLGYLVNRYAFGRANLTSPANTPGERRWFVAYGVASFLYRTLVVGLIILFVGSQYLLLGVLLALWGLYILVLAPLGKRLAYVLFDPALGRNRARAMSVSAAALGLAFALIAVVPLPLWTDAEGVVWLPESAWVRAAADGQVTDVTVSAGQSVAADEPLIVHADPLLLAKIELHETELVTVTRQYEAAQSVDRVEARILKDRLDLVRQQLDDARTRAEALVARSPSAGVFWPARPVRDWPGHFSKRGDALGVVVPAGALTARVIIDQDDIDLVRARTEAVRARLAGNLAATYEAKVTRQTPAASRQLPSAALSIEGGGRRALDPRETDNLVALEPGFLLDIALPASAEVTGVGERVYVRIEHGNEVLIKRLYRFGRRLFLERFDV